MRFFKCLRPPQPEEDNIVQDNNISNPYFAMPFITKDACISQISRDASSLVDLVEPSRMDDRIAYLESQDIKFQSRRGSGNFSDIYRCRMHDNSGDTDVPRSFAVKRVNLKDKKNKNFTRKFLPREILIHSSIEHANIVQYINTLVTRTDAYLVMEFVPLLNLFDYCKEQGRLKLDRVFRISSQLVSAVSYLHAKDIVHRDIKCENIMFKSYVPEHIKLLDFGFSKRLGMPQAHSTTNHLTLAQLLESAHGGLKQTKSNVNRDTSPLDEFTYQSKCSKTSLTVSRSSYGQAMQGMAGTEPKVYLTRTFCGSLAYVAPEMLREPRKDYDAKKTDVWSIGVLTYIIATHRMPYKESNGMVRLKKELYAPLVWPRDFYDRDFQATIETILRIEVDDRLSVYSIPKLPWFRKQEVLEKSRRIPVDDFSDMIRRSTAHVSV